MKKIFIITIITLICSIPTGSKSMGLKLDIHGGLSGTSSFYLLALYLDSIDDEVVYIDFTDIHFITGEAGTALRFEFGSFGFALDFMAGYYLHFAQTPNIVSYFLAQGGMEFYYNFKNYAYVGVGAGFFFGYMYMDYDIYTSDAPADHYGVSVWITSGFTLTEYSFLSLSFRYHRFLHIGLLDTGDPSLAYLTNDMIFCLRFGVRITFLKTRF